VRARADDSPAEGLDGEASTTEAPPDHPRDRHGEEGETGDHGQERLRGPEDDAGEPHDDGPQGGELGPSRPERGGQADDRREQQQDEDGHEQRLVAADRQGDRDELLPRQGGARHELTEAAEGRHRAPESLRRHREGHAEQQVGGDRQQHHPRAREPQHRPGDRHDAAGGDRDEGEHHELGALVHGPEDGGRDEQRDEVQAGGEEDEGGAEPRATDARPQVAGSRRGGVLHAAHVAAALASDFCRSSR
jgi:hypothetical protein